MASRRLASACLAVLLLLFAAHAAYADSAVGAACSPNGLITRTGGAETSGVGAQMVCAGGIWISTVGYDGSGNASISNAVSVTGDISPTSLSADQNDYNPTGLSTAAVVRLTSSTAVNITGLAGGADGRAVTIFNIGSNNVVLKNQSTSSTAANRFAINADITLGADQSATIIYDSTSQRWRSASIPFSGGGTTSYAGACFDAWTARDTDRDWQGLASSSDGAKLAATVSGGTVYTSTDSGATWTARAGSGSRDWRAIASSSDGAKLVALVNAGQIYTSTDSGVTWTARNSNRQWNDVASSSDGTKLVASVDGGQIYTSTDSGATWTARDSNRSWDSVVSSADGTKLAAHVGGGGGIYTSANSGVTWTPRASSPDDAWGLASSSDGTRLVAGTEEGGGGGGVYTSTDSGATWTEILGANHPFPAAASSSDGTIIAVGGYGGPVYYSTDSGATWSARAAIRIWMGIVSSSDGTKLAAFAEDGQIYTSDCTSPIPSCTNDSAAQCVLQATRSSGDPQFLAANIKSGVNVLGVTGALVPGCTAPTLCPNVGDVCNDGNAGNNPDPQFAGFMVYNDPNSADTGKCKALYVTNNNQSTASQWKTSSGSDDIATDSTEDGLISDTLVPTSTTFPGFKLCKDLTVGGFTDWYLPARDELHLLWKNRTAINAQAGGAFTSSYYWSSTEYDVTYAWLQNFGDGHQDGGTKTDSNDIRCVRR